MAAVTYQHVRQAHERISSYIHKTPVLSSAIVNRLAGRKLYFKAECFQKTGSFKARGALNALLSIKERCPDVCGVITHSSGNHGIAVAFAAQKCNLPCTVVVPKNSSPTKISAIQDYGAEVVFCEPNPTSRMSTCQKLAEETGKAIIHPFDNFDVMAGQGTIALEFLEQAPFLDAILVPISGGGMTAGIAVATKKLKEQCKVYAVEPKGKNLQASLEAGSPLWPHPPQFVDTVADALRMQALGELTFPIVSSHAEKTVFTVDDQSMISAMKLIWEKMKVVVEVSSAAGVAAVFSEQMKELDPEFKLNIGVILCGGNADLDNLPWIKK